MLWLTWGQYLRTFPLIRLHRIHIYGRHYIWLRLLDINGWRGLERAPYDEGNELHEGPATKRVLNWRFAFYWGFGGKDV